MDEETPDHRLYVNPQPKKGKFSAEWQRAYLPAGDEYVEDKSGKVFDTLLRSLRAASVVVVRRLFCLAPWSGTPTVRKNAMAKRIDAIEAKGAAIMEGETGRRTDRDDVRAQMIVGAVADIASAGRAGPKRKRGNPVEISAEHEAMAKLIWRSRDHANDKARLAAIEAATGCKLKRSWCWARWGSPSAPASQS